MPGLAQDEIAPYGKVIYCGWAFSCGALASDMVLTPGFQVAAGSYFSLVVGVDGFVYRSQSR